MTQSSLPRTVRADLDIAISRLSAQDVQVLATTLLAEIAPEGATQPSSDAHRRFRRHAGRVLERPDELNDPDEREWRTILLLTAAARAVLPGSTLGAHTARIEQQLDWVAAVQNTVVTGPRTIKHHAMFGHGAASKDR